MEDFTVGHISDNFIKHVSPVTTEVDRARLRLEEKMIEGEPHMPLVEEVVSWKMTFTYHCREED